MELLLIIIVIILVLAITAVLSRPFWKPAPVNGTMDADINYELQYQQLLIEIKSLESKLKENQSSQDYAALIEEKKDQAANLLRQIDSPEYDDLESNPENIETQDDNPDQNGPPTDRFICPQCGSRVHSSDKFCPRCGSRLTP